MGKQVLRREQDWHGVKLQLSEKVLIAAVIGVANGVAAAAALLLK